MARPGLPGLVLALVALCLQLVAPGLHSPSLASLGAGSELARLLDAHTLCIAADAGQPSSGAPAEQAPQPEDHHHGACCPWHGSASPFIPAPAALEPIGFHYAGVSFSTPSTVIVAARLPGTVRARAPPAGA